jgi:hypothetical protein
MIEHPDICEVCGEWVPVSKSRVVEHEWPGDPKNAHEKRAWKKSGKPICGGSGRRIGYPTHFIDDGRG